MEAHRKSWLWEVQQISDDPGKQDWEALRSLQKHARVLIPNRVVHCKKGEGGGGGGDEETHER